MANREHVALLNKGVAKWNAWRVKKENIAVTPDFTEADLHQAFLYGADLRHANLESADLDGVNLQRADLEAAHLERASLQGANLRGADLCGTNLEKADLRRADLRWADLSGTNLGEANLGEAQLNGANFYGANLAGADLHKTHLWLANLTAAQLRDANLSGASLSDTIFSDVSLRDVQGLDARRHEGPSTIDHRTLAPSGTLPLAFLCECGLPDKFIEYLPSLLNQAIQFYSCFISYSTSDQAFADRLHADLQDKGVRCWFAPHDMQGGKKVHEQIDEAIRLYDQLLLIVSEHSMNSEWVQAEIAKARRRELREGRRMLFPVRLIDFETLRGWECFDADTGKDSAREIREYFILISASGRTKTPTKRRSDA